MHGKLQFFLPSFVNSMGKSNLLSERGKKKICTIGTGSRKVMVNQPAFVGAAQQDVVGSSHGGDQAMALACIPFQCINGEHASLAIPSKEIQISQTVLLPASSSGTRRLSSSSSSSSSQECYN
jgi:hypothetical protein